jgi:hypothetical protein
MRPTKNKQEIELFIKNNVALWEALKASPQPSNLCVYLADGTNRTGFFVGTKIEANREYVRDRKWSGCITLGDSDGRTTVIDFLDVKFIVPEKHSTENLK